MKRIILILFAIGITATMQVSDKTTICRPAHLLPINKYHHLFSWAFNREPLQRESTCRKHCQQKTKNKYQFAYHIFSILSSNIIINRMPKVCIFFITYILKVKLF